MQVREVMSSNVKVINQNRNLVEAARLMRETDCGSIPVESGDRLVGMITDRDIAVRAVAEGKHPEDEPVKNYMSEGIKYCLETDDVADVGEMMRQNRLRRLPVLNSEKRLTGIVSIGDLARLTDEEELVYETMHDICEHDER